MLELVIFVIGVLLGILVTTFIFIKKLCRGDVLVAGNGYLTIELSDDSQFDKIRKHRFVLFKVRNKNRV